MPFDKSSLGDNLDYSQHFTGNAQESFRRASRMATEMGAGLIGTEHLLLGILGQKQAAATRVLNNAGVSFDRLRASLLDQPPKPSAAIQTGAKQLTDASKMAIGVAYRQAQELNQDVCGTEHIVYSILSQPQAKATVMLTNMNVDINTLKNRIEALMTRHMSEIDIVGVWTTKDSARGRAAGQDFARELYQKLNQVAETRTKQRPSILEHFSTDLTLRAQKGRLDPVIGRQAQITRTITILNRRQKNNPVLIGEPGVGKTAIVEGLAQQIVAERVPDSLVDKRIVTLDLASMIAGTKYRGEFEDRFRRVLAELAKNKKTIVFIDEIHLLVGAGAAEGAIDASNMLKPALARSHIQVVGATTIDEYTKHIEKDTALERRLQPIIVPETNRAETLAILHGLAKKYEQHHQIQINDEILARTVHLADRYLNDRFMPDKAIDLLDEAAAHLRVEQSKINPVERDLRRRIRLTQAEIEQLVADQDYELAAQRKQEIAKLEAKIKASGQKRSAAKTRPQLTPEHLAAVVSNWTGVPVKQVVKSEARSLLNLEKQLQKQIVGQPDAVRAVATAIRRSRSGISDPKRPIGSFLFLGPTGVGKTELARVLATSFYGRDDALVKIDMSEFAERHTVARLIGAPAGYLGFDHPGQLTEKIRRQPYSLVLFDEVEKAHPEVFNILLQILEDGTLTDAKGRTVSFSNTIVILTSNLGAEALQKDVNLGFASLPAGAKAKVDALQEQNEARLQQELKTFMRPELVNRFDKIIVFRSLTPANINKIVDIQLDRLGQRLLEQRIALTITPGVKKWLARRGYDTKNGVRPLRRLIQDQLENAVAEIVLESGLGGDNRIVKLQLAGNEIKASLSSES